MLVRSLLFAGLAFVASSGFAQVFVAAKPDAAAVAARKAEIKRFGFTRLMSDPSRLREAAKVLVDRPLDAAQATVLARAYFSMRAGACGSLGPAEDRASSWSFSTREGYAGKPGQEIMVDKATGRTSSKGFVTVDRPKDYLRYILPGRESKKV